MLTIESMISQAGHILFADLSTAGWVIGVSNPYTRICPQKFKTVNVICGHSFLEEATLLVSLAICLVFLLNAILDLARWFRAKTPALGASHSVWCVHV